MSEYIAERKLLFALKGEAQRKPFVVRVLASRLVKAVEVGVDYGEDAAVCIVRLEGLPSVVEEKIYGADTLQALQLAADVEPILKRISKKYDLYFPTGEDYFE